MITTSMKISTLLSILIKTVLKNMEITQNKEILDEEK